MKRLTPVLLLVLACRTPETKQPPAEECATSDATSFYLDADGDGFGSGEAVVACTQPSGYVLRDGDCDDSDPAIHPKTRWYQDLDQDGFGDSRTKVVGCEAPAGFVTNADDCDDADASIHPDQNEVFGDGIDQNCDGHDAHNSGLTGDTGGSLSTGGTGISHVTGSTGGTGVAGTGDTGLIGGTGGTGLPPGTLWIERPQVERVAAGNRATVRIQVHDDAPLSVNVVAATTDLALMPNLTVLRGVDDQRFIQFEPPSGTVGSATLTLTATDLNGNQAVSSITIDVAEDYNFLTSPNLEPAYPVSSHPIPTVTELAIRNTLLVGGGQFDEFLGGYYRFGHTLWSIDSAGTVVDIRRFNNTVSDYGLRMAVDATGTVYLGGDGEQITRSTGAGVLDLFATIPPGGQYTSRRSLGLDVNATGQLLWVSALSGTTTGTAVEANRLDATGAVTDTIPLVTWNTLPTSPGDAVLEDDGSGCVSFAASEDYAGFTNQGLSDAYVVCFDATGTTTFVDHLGTPQVDTLVALETDGLGNLFAAGAADAPRPPATPGGRAVVRKYTSVAGIRSVAWTYYAGDPSFRTIATSLSVGPDGDVYVVGRWQADASGWSKIWVAAIDGSTGDERWLRTFGGATYLEATAVVHTGHGLIVGGNKSTDIVTDGITPVQLGRAWLIRLTDGGSFQF